MIYYTTISRNFRKKCHTIEIEKCLTQNVPTVEMIVKYHSNQQKIGLFIAENVSKSINQHQEVVVVDLEEDLVKDLVKDLVEDLVAMVDVIEIPDLVEETTDHEKCLTQNAATVEMIVKYHSNQKTTDLFITEIVSKITNKISRLF
jgi:hypothetical protein